MIACWKKKERKSRLIPIPNTVFIGSGNNLLTVAPYVPSQANQVSRTETTIFDQVYSGQRRRPGMISLNVQWMPVDERSGTYQWKESDASGRKMKTVTFFGTGGMRGQQSPKPVTPPGSDYTDAYLSAFAAKPIPTRHVHRLNTAVFDTSAPIPLKPTTIPISTTSSIKTSQTRFVSINDIQKSSSFERPTPSPSDRSSTYSPSFVAPERPTNFESFSRTHYSSPQSQTHSTNANDFQTLSSFERSIPTPSDRSSTYSPSFAAEKSTTYEPTARTQYVSPQSQTYTSNYSTSVRSPVPTMTTTPIPSIDSQRTYTTFRNYSQTIPFTYSPPSRVEKTCFDSIYKPLPPYSFQAYPPSSGYSSFLPPLPTGLSPQPYVPFSSAPITSSFSSTQTTTNERTILPASITTEKPLDRPETLLFQHDEDLRSPSRVEKPSPLLTPSPQSPMIRDEVKGASGPSASEQSSSFTSEPISILENTLSKYDALINQISEVLASVSPLSSTISSMSPGKSVLDYQLSSDSSPVLPHKRLDSEPSPSSTTSKNVDTQRTRESHLIREDSYDKIVTVMSDLDRNLTSPSDIQKASPVREESDEDDIKTPAIEDYRMPPIEEEENLQSNIPSLEELQSTPETKQETEATPITEPPTIVVVEDQEQKEIPAGSIVEEQLASSESKSSNVEESEIKDEHVSTTEISISNEPEILSTSEEGEKGETSSALTAEEKNKESTTSSTTESSSSVVDQEEKIELKTSLQEEQQEIISETSDKSETPIVVEEKKEDSIVESTSPTVQQEENMELKTSLQEEEQKETKTEVSDGFETPIVVEEKKEDSIVESASPTVQQEENMELKTSSQEEEQGETKTEVSGGSEASIVVEEKKEESTVESESPSLNQEEKVELITSLKEEQGETKTEITDESETSMVTEEKKEEPTISVMTDSEGPATHEEEKKEEVTSVPLEEPSSTVEEKNEEAATSSATAPESQEIVEEEKVELKTFLQEPETTTPSSTEYQTPSVIDSESPVIDQEEKADLKIVPEEIKTEVSDEHQIPSITDERKDELVSSPVTDSESSTIVEELTPLITEQTKEEIKTESSDVSQTSSAIEETKEEALTQTASSTEQSISEESSVQSVSTLTDTAVEQPIQSSEEPVTDEQSKAETSQFIQEQVDLLASVPSDAPVTQEVNDIPAVTKTSKKTRKHVTWDETVVDNEDNGSSSESDAEEGTDTVVDGASTVADQQSTSSEISELQSTSEESTSSSTSTEPSSEDNLQTISPTTAVLETSSAEQQISSSSQSEYETAHPTPAAVEVESNPFTSTDHPKTVSISFESSNVVESPVTPHEEETDSRGSPDVQSTSTIDSSKEDTLTADEVSTTTSDVVSQETSAESAPLSSQPTIVSPIETLADTISNRYTSSDVYHGYLGDHQTTSQELSNVDDDTTKKSLLASLRETIATPIIPLIESIQSVVSSMQTTSTISTSKSESEMTSHIDESTPAATTDDVKPTVDTSEKLRAVFESLREVVTAPITAISETIETAVSNLQSDKEEVSATSVVGQELILESTSDENDRRELQDNLTSEPTLPVVVQPVEEPSTIEEKTLESSISTSVERSSETAVESELEEHASTETKTTLEVIRDVITHPITTITETIQHILPSSTSDESSKEQQITETKDVNATTGTEQSESSETKTTLETIRDALTHPIATITEKVQSIIPTSSNEQVSSTTSEQIESVESESSLGATEANTIEVEPSNAAPSETVQTTESKTTFESLRDAITHPIATITEKIQSVISSSTSEELPAASQEIATPTVDPVTSTPVESTSNIVSNTIEATNKTDDVVSTITDQTSSSNTQEQIVTNEEFETHTQDQIQGDQQLRSVPVSSSIYDDEKTESTSEPSSHRQTRESASSLSDDSISFEANQLLVDTIRDLINDTINTVLFSLSHNTVQIQSTAEDSFTWNNLLGEKSPDQEVIQSYNEVQQLLDESAPSSKNLGSPQIDDIMQRSSNELESDSTSAVTEIEQIPAKPLGDDREASPFNVEDDSLELINALQGHSILRPPSSSPPIQTPTNTQPLTTIEKVEEFIPLTREKSSSSTTTSSQVTSSDRYVSYAIHEMGDSSQERLPSFPLAADLPVYQTVKTPSEEHRAEQILSGPAFQPNSNLVKDDDLTELDATENLTSFSDDQHVQKHHRSTKNQQEILDASSTDEDVDDENFSEFDQPDVTNLYRIVGEITQQSSTFSGDDAQTYQRYDLSSTSSMSTRAHGDDVYIIPGYPGLWRPSADDEHTHSSFANDADDEDEKKQATSTIKTRTIVRTTDPAKLQSFLQHQSHEFPSQEVPLRPESIDIFNRPLNEFSFDASESDSFKTCASTINSSSVSKQVKQSEVFEQTPIEEQEHQLSPDEKIFLIRERERGVSLPVTMKIDYDDMALRLSTSTPIDAQLYSPTQTDLPSPSTHSEPIQKTTSSSRASTPSLSSNESEQPKTASSSSWLNTVNTVTTIIEGPDGPLESRTTIHKSSKGPISVAECDAQGKYILIENTSRSKSLALAGWKLRQENDNGDVLTYTFPENCLLRPNHTIKVLTKSNESERRNSDLIAPLSSTWHTGSNVVTTLINADGKDRASLTKKTLFS